VNNSWDANGIFRILSESIIQENDSDLTVYQFDEKNQIIIGRKIDGSIFLGCPQIGDIDGFSTPRANLEVFQTIELKNRGKIEPALVLSFHSFSEDELKSVSTIFAGIYDLNKNSFGEDEATKAAQGFKDFFSKIPKVTMTREEEIGLFGELTAIFSSTKKDYMIRGWHSTPNSTYDFSLEGNRLEVKTSSRPTRHVWLRAGQTIESTVNDLTYLSIYAIEDNSGMTLGELANEIINSVDSVAKQDLMDKVSFYEIEKCKLKFDLKGTIRSFKFISGSDVPILSNMDSRILDFTWKCSFDSLPNLEIPNTWSIIMGIE
jgi:hypothetical protein